MTRRASLDGLNLAVTMLMGLASIAIVWKLLSPTARPTSKPVAIPRQAIPMTSLPILGDAAAPAGMIVFTDFQCPFCRQFAVQTFPSIRAKYIEPKRLQFAVKHFPLSEIHPYAEQAAVAADCAKQQGRFWEYHDHLFASPSTFNDRLLDETSELVSVNDATFGACTRKGAAGQVERDRSDAVVMGIASTPTFFVGTTSRDGLRVQSIVSGAQPLAVFEAAIEKALQSSGR